MNVRPLALIVFLLAPLSVFAGQGWVIEVGNDSVPIASNTSTGVSTTYPIVTPHIIYGATCWYDKEILYWDKWADAGNGYNHWYTEEEDSFFTNCLNTPVEHLRGFAMFIKRNQFSGWELFSAPMLLHTDVQGGNSEIKTYTIKRLEGNVSGQELARIGGNQDFNIGSICGMNMYGTFKLVSDKPLLTVSVTGQLDNQCFLSLGKTAASYKYSNISPQASMAPYSSTVTIKIRAGSTKLIKLPQVSDNTSWELTQCSGDAITTDGVIPRKTNVGIPNQVRIKAVNKGQEECIVNAWAYSSDVPNRTFVVGKKYRFDVD